MRSMMKTAPVSIMSSASPAFSGKFLGNALMLLSLTVGSAAAADLTPLGDGKIGDATIGKLIPGRASSNKPAANPRTPEDKKYRRNLSAAEIGLLLGGIGLAGLGYQLGKPKIIQYIR